MNVRSLAFAGLLLIIELGIEESIGVVGPARLQFVRAFKPCYFLVYVVNGALCLGCAHGANGGQCHCHADLCFHCSVSFLVVVMLFLALSLSGASK